MNRPAWIRLGRRWLGRDRADPSNADLVEQLYQGVLGRAADDSGRASHVAALDAGAPLAELIAGMLRSDEFSHKNGSLRIAPAQLPDLTVLFPQRYRREPDATTVFEACTDEDFHRLEQAIHEYRYYDSFGVWSPTVDLDKRVTAALVTGLGTRRSLELGCFTGCVMGLLHDAGVDVTGVELSHLAFVLAAPSIRNRIAYGDLLSLDLRGRYDAIIAMDILEHLNPVKLDDYLERLGGLLGRDGYFLVNSPMFGHDEVFGEVAGCHLPEWRDAGDASFWRYLHCDAKGWPLHGHLVWASPRWWERQFATHGLLRDVEIETRIHAALGGFFATCAPARKSFFLLRHADNRKIPGAVAGDVAARLAAVLAETPIMASAAAGDATYPA